MVLISAPILLAAAPFFGPLIREVQPIHWVWLVFQAEVIVAGVFITWLWLLPVSPTCTIASFSFLTPLFVIILGYLISDEALSFGLIMVAGFVVAGIILINRC